MKSIIVKSFITILEYFFRLIPSNFFKAFEKITIIWTTAYWKRRFSKCGHNVVIRPKITVYEPGKVCVGDYVSFGEGVHIYGNGGVNIGNYVMIGHYSTLTTATHDYKVSLMYDTFLTSPIVIKDNVWIGANCIILSGVIIESGCVVGAGSVVTHSVSENQIVAGNPARMIKNR